MPEVFMIGGANGAGKTTAAMTLLPGYLEIYEFVNADEIARGLNPLRPETADLAAGRIMIRRIRELTEAKKNFAFETTCAGRHHIKTFQDCRAAGYRLNLIYLWLPSVEMAVQRVKLRAQQGGHAIPEERIRRRYVTGTINVINTYLPLADTATFIDNSDPERQELIAGKVARAGLQIYNRPIWQQIIAMADAGD